MNDYKNLPFSEQEKLLLLSLELDEEIVREHLVPKESFYIEQGALVLQETEGEQLDKEISLGVLLLLTESHTRSHIKTTLNTCSKDEEIVNELLPHHSFVKYLVKYIKENTLTFSVPFVRILLREKEVYQKLLEELTQLIRQHTSNADALLASQPPSPDSPIQNIVEQVQGEVMKRLPQEKEGKKILITVKPDELQRVMKTLLPHIDPEHEHVLYDLLNTGASIERIKFKGNSLQLGEIFQRLEEKGILIGGKVDTHLIEWLCSHFLFLNEKLKEYKPVTLYGIRKVFKENKKPKEPIFLFKVGDFLGD